MSPNKKSSLDLMLMTGIMLIADIYFAIESMIVWNANYCINPFCRIVSWMQDLGWAALANIKLILHWYLLHSQSVVLIPALTSTLFLPLKMIISFKLISDRFCNECWHQNCLQPIDLLIISFNLPSLILMLSFGKKGCTNIKVRP